MTSFYDFAEKWGFDTSVGNSQEKDVYFINKDHIVWAKPGEDISDPDSESTLPTTIDSGPRTE